MAQRRLTTLATILREAGLRVVEITGWEDRSRPSSTGDFHPVGVLWHHTGPGVSGLKGAKWMALDGRSDLPAPLVQLSIDRNGTVYVLAAGRANHAGVAKASGTVAAGDGNALYIGVECMNSGTEGWSTAQYGAMVKTGAALARLLGTSVNAQRGHKETSVTGKWDPGALDMDKFRHDIAARLAPKPTPKPVAKARILAAATVKTPSDHLAVAARLVAGKAAFEVATANVRATPPMRAVNVQRCIDLATGIVGVSVVGFCEMGARDLVSLLANRPGWVAVQGPKGDQRRAPIAYDSAVWTPIRTEFRQLSWRDVVTGIGKVSVPSGNRWATIAVLGHKATGVEVAFVSYHAIAHMNVGAGFGWTGRGPAVLLKLRDKIRNPAASVFRQGMRRLEALVGELRKDGCYVVTLGDLNFDAFADLKAAKPALYGPQRTFRRMGAVSIYSTGALKHGTSGKRGIDYVTIAPPA